ncbi:uncharacterized protein FYW47_003947 [Aplochiton taeniatus]
MMTEAIATFQSQLSGVMETVFKAAMYEITRLVEDSFLEEVTRSREQVESLKRRLKWSENRRRERDRECEQKRCADCGRSGGSGEEAGERPTQPAQIALDKCRGLKQERVLKEEINGFGDAEEDTADRELDGVDLENRSPRSRDQGTEKLNRLLKEESLHASADSADIQDRWAVSLDEAEGSDLSGPSKSFSERELQECQDEWAAGLDQGSDPGPDGDTADPSQPLYRTRYTMEELGGFEKAGYGGGHMLDMGELDVLPGSSPRLSGGLGYGGMGHFQDNLAECVGDDHQSTQRSRRGALGSPSGSPSRSSLEVGEFDCLLINEEGYLQEPGALYSEHSVGPSGGRGGHRGQPAADLQPGETSHVTTDELYSSSQSYSHALSLSVERPQHQGATGRGSKRHTCNQCPMSFLDAASLKTHKQTHKANQGAPLYSCNQCGKTFTQACNLKVHQRIHSGQGLHLCSHCGKGFPSFSDLKTHKCSQTVDKPYCCTVCGNKFSRLWNLKLHRRIHTQEKPHRCTMCDKRFTRADILKVHQRTHTGERPYCCAICGLSFKRLDHLKSHQRKHRPDLQN